MNSNRVNSLQEKEGITVTLLSYEHAGGLRVMPAIQSELKSHLYSSRYFLSRSLPVYPDSCTASVRVQERSREP
ncbi:hypothetical protein RchiOBHm_Chr7g0200691 [Rosa chinensis]|uniref:Uncharacterized protein n=1 Tax=Rosa chinensis TaxID=74649 RepID=A0A2P6P7Q2_ROSCH|nr:hypothetical protein RchiOBHm_Chr7g0200691 [Rosa chinensis]